MNVDKTSEVGTETIETNKVSCFRGARCQVFLEGTALRLGAERPRDRSQSVYHLQAQAASGFGVRADELAQSDGEKRNIR